MTMKSQPRVPRQTRERFQVTLVVERPGTPGAVRLQHFLKAAIRAYGLRAVKVVCETDEPNLLLEGTCREVEAYASILPSENDSGLQLVSEANCKVEHTRERPAG